MKKHVFPLLVIMLLALTALSLFSCEWLQTSEEPFDYTVTVTDGGGNAIKGVIVKLYDSNGTQVGANVSGADGKVLFKDIVVGDYTARISNSTTDYNFASTEYSLTANEEGSVISFYEAVGEATVEIYGAVSEGTLAYPIATGYYELDIKAGETLYLLLYVAENGIFTVTGTADAYVGYYGMPTYVQANHLLDDAGDYDGLGFELEIPDINAPYVLGVTAQSDMTAVLGIERTDELPNRPEYMQWVHVPARENLVSYTLPTGSTLSEFDITDLELEVTRGDDGRYYTADGNLVVLRISTASASEYLLYTEFPSLKQLAGLSDEGVGDSGVNIGGYVYDSDGNFVTKESYNSMIETYLEYCDPDAGVYPLTDELLNMLKLHGNSSGWWDAGSPNCIFDALILNEDYAWLFMCSFVVKN